jgi:carboxyl-terminal processing protease
VSKGDRSGFGSGVVLGLVMGLVLAALVGVLLEVLPDLGGDDAVTEAQETIQNNYFQSVGDTELEQGSIQGMVDELRRRHDDKFSHYFTPEQLKQFDAATSGSFEGVGLTVTEVARGLRVASVLPDTPAERAGLEEGDVITAVDGESIAGVASEVSTAQIKGPAGTEVELRIVPAGGGPARNVSVQRADVRVPAVDGVIRRIGDRKVAYVRFATFSEGAHGELRDTVEDLYRRGAEGLVLDLRGNGGGLLNEAILSASIFVEDGTIVSTESRTQGDQSYDAVGDAIPERPTVVLVDRGTASAAEILTAALQTYDLADVVGTRTFGKGTFQEVIDLDAGGALDLTIGQYLTADGTSILGTGVKPDDPAKDDAKTEDRDEGLEGALQVLGDHL